MSEVIVESLCVSCMVIGRCGQVVIIATIVVVVVLLLPLFLEPQTAVR